MIDPFQIIRHHSTEKAREALQRIHRNATGQIHEPYMSIPVNFERDADVILSDVIRERDALAKRVSELEAALLPFANAADELSDEDPMASPNLVVPKVIGPIQTGISQYRLIDARTVLRRPWRDGQ